MATNGSKNCTLRIAIYCNAWWLNKSDSNKLIWKHSAKNVYTMENLDLFDRTSKCYVNTCMSHARRNFKHWIYIFLIILVFFQCRLNMHSENDHALILAKNTPVKKHKLLFTGNGHQKYHKSYVTIFEVLLTSQKLYFKRNEIREIYWKILHYTFKNWMLSSKVSFWLLIRHYFRNKQEEKRQENVRELHC